MRHGGRREHRQGRRRGCRHQRSQSRLDGREGGGGSRPRIQPPGGAPIGWGHRPRHRHRRRRRRRHSNLPRPQWQRQERRCARHNGRGRCRRVGRARRCSCCRGGRHTRKLVEVTARNGGVMRRRVSDGGERRGGPPSSRDRARCKGQRGGRPEPPLRRRGPNQDVTLTDGRVSGATASAATAASGAPGRCCGSSGRRRQSVPGKDEQQGDERGGEGCSQRRRPRGGACRHDRGGWCRRGGWDEPQRGGPVAPISVHTTVAAAAAAVAAAASGMTSATRIHGLVTPTCGNAPAAGASTAAGASAAAAATVAAAAALRSVASMATAGGSQARP